MFKCAELKNLQYCSKGQYGEALPKAEVAKERADFIEALTNWAKNGGSGRSSWGDVSIVYVRPEDFAGRVAAAKGRKAFVFLEEVEL